MQKPHGNLRAVNLFPYLLLIVFGNQYSLRRHYPYQVKGFGSRHLSHYGHPRLLCGFYSLIIPPHRAFVKQIFSILSIVEIRSYGFYAHRSKQILINYYISLILLKIIGEKHTLKI